MFDPLSKADRYRTVAAEFANLARTASSDFPRGYYQRIAERYQLPANWNRRKTRQLRRQAWRLVHRRVQWNRSPQTCTTEASCRWCSKWRAGSVSCRPGGRTDPGCDRRRCRASIEFAVAKVVIEAAQAHESETPWLGDPDGAPATAFEVVRQPPLEPKNAAGGQFDPAELDSVHGIPHLRG
jgi:hypothetical protein